MKKSRKLLPKLRKISKKNKKYHYKLKYPHKKRILAINEGVRHEMKHKKRTKRKAAIAKKARFNYGLIVGRGSAAGNVFRLQPPMCIEEKDIIHITDALEQGAINYLNL